MWGTAKLSIGMTWGPWQTGSHQVKRIPGQCSVYRDSQNRRLTVLSGQEWGSGRWSGTLMRAGRYVGGGRGVPLFRDPHPLTVPTADVCDIPTPPGRGPSPEASPTAPALGSAPSPNRDVAATVDKAGNESDAALSAVGDTSGELAMMLGTPAAGHSERTSSAGGLSWEYIGRPSV